jgi:glutamate-1-semialdehyde 2,1-aminomutase
MKVVAIIQARMGSSRLPNKVMRKINDVPMIGLLLARLSLSKEINQIIIATTTNSKDDELVEYLKSQGYKCERGSENDVLKRFYFAAKNNQAEIVVRITGDCPLIDSQIVDSCIQELKAQGKDYFSNIMPASYPDGLDVEVLTMNALKR